MFPGRWVVLDKSGRLYTVDAYQLIQEVKSGLWQDMLIARLFGSKHTPHYYHRDIHDSLWRVLRQSQTMRIPVHYTIPLKGKERMKYRKMLGCCALRSQWLSNLLNILKASHVLPGPLPSWTVVRVDQTTFHDMKTVDGCREAVRGVMAVLQFLEWQHKVTKCQCWNGKYGIISTLAQGFIMGLMDYVINIYKICRQLSVSCSQFIRPRIDQLECHPICPSVNSFVILSTQKICQLATP